MGLNAFTPVQLGWSLSEHVGKTTLTMVSMLSIGLGHTFPHEHGDYLGYPSFWDNTVYEKTRKKSLTISGRWIYIWLDKCQERLTKGSTCLLSYFFGWKGCPERDCSWNAATKNAAHCPDYHVSTIWLWFHPLFWWCGSARSAVVNRLSVAQRTCRNIIGGFPPEGNVEKNDDGSLTSLNLH